MGGSSRKRWYILFVLARQLPRTNAECLDFLAPRRLRVNHDNTIFDHTFHKVASSPTSDVFSFLLLLPLRRGSTLLTIFPWMFLSWRSTLSPRLSLITLLRTTVLSISIIWIRLRSGPPRGLFFSKLIVLHMNVFELLFGTWELAEILLSHYNFHVLNITDLFEQRNVLQTWSCSGLTLPSSRELVTIESMSRFIRVPLRFRNIY